MRVPDIVLFDGFRPHDAVLSFETNHSDPDGVALNIRTQDREQASGIYLNRRAVRDLIVALTDALYHED